MRSMPTRFEKAFWKSCRDIKRWMGLIAGSLMSRTELIAEVRRWEHADGRQSTEKELEKRSDYGGWASYEHQ